MTPDDREDVQCQADLDQLWMQARTLLPDLERVMRGEQPVTIPTRTCIGFAISLVVAEVATRMVAEQKAEFYDRP